MRPQLASKVPPRSHAWGVVLQLHFINNIFANSGMVAAFGLEDLRLSNFIGCVAANHRTNPYHNLMHACYVLQATHLIVHATKATGALPDTAHLALLIAALCHDIDHDGAACWSAWRAPAHMQEGPGSTCSCTSQHAPDSDCSPSVHSRADVLRLKV